MSSVDLVEPLSVNDLGKLSLEDSIVNNSGEACFNHHGGVCAICLDEIVLEETALVKGCEHSYCVTCILQWATYHENPTCPQCKLRFDSLDVHRSLDGRIHDYMFEESVCLLVRAAWFKPLTVEDHGDVNDESYVYYPYEAEDEDDDLEEYFTPSGSLRIGNRRWGDNGFVRAGRQEARPVYQPNSQASASGSSRAHNNKGVPKDATGRRAKRALKRQAAAAKQNTSC